MPIYQLTDKIVFPPPQLSLNNGLLAIGGDLSQERLLTAYRMGIFPWFSDSEPILWWSPDPRLVLYPGEFKVSKSLKKKIKQNIFSITIDHDFYQVITACARVRLQNNIETWIGKDMIAAYCRLHKSGYAHSVEAWYRKKLAGGLYGVSLGRCFFGESMFTRIRDASKVALAALVKHLSDHSFDMIDCQVPTAHLSRLGARKIPKARFLEQLEQAVVAPSYIGKWSFQTESNHAN